LVPRSYKECLDLLKAEKGYLMAPKNRDLIADREPWLASFTELEQLFVPAVLRLLGHTPDVPQNQWLMKSAGMGLFLFVTIQKALASGDHGFLVREFEARWDRLLKPFISAVYERDISPAEFEAILTVRGNVCPSSTCGTAGMTEEICGVCTKGAASDKKFVVDKAAAKSAFDALHPNMAAAERLALFYKKNSHFSGSGPKSQPTTRAAALLYIFNNQGKIALPFCVV
jgi:hypothetical protein